MVINFEFCIVFALSLPYLETISVLVFLIVVLVVLCTHCETQC